MKILQIKHMLYYLNIILKNVSYYNYQRMDIRIGCIYNCTLILINKIYPEKRANSLVSYFVQTFIVHF